MLSAAGSVPRAREARGARGAGHALHLERVDPENCHDALARVLGFHDSGISFSEQFYIGCESVLTRNHKLMCQWSMMGCCTLRIGLAALMSIWHAPSADPGFFANSTLKFHSSRAQATSSGPRKLHSLHQYRYSELRRQRTGLAAYQANVCCHLEHLLRLCRMGVCGLRSGLGGSLGGSGSGAKENQRHHGDTYHLPSLETFILVYPLD